MQETHALRDGQGDLALQNCRATVLAPDALCVDDIESEVLSVLDPVGIKNDSDGARHLPIRSDNLPVSFGCTRTRNTMFSLHGTITISTSSGRSTKDLDTAKSIS